MRGYLESRSLLGEKAVAGQTKSAMAKYPLSHRVKQLYSVIQTRSHDGRMSEVFSRMFDGCTLVTIMATSNLLVSRYFLTTIQVGIAACLFSSDLINLKASSVLSFLSLVCIFLCAKRSSYRGLIKRALRISVDTRTVLLHR